MLSAHGGPHGRTRGRACASDVRTARTSARHRLGRTLALAAAALLSSVACNLAYAEGDVAGTLSAAELQRRLPLADGQPARVDEVARSVDASINFWQIREGMPPHLHRAHEEVIVVLDGSVETTIGDRRVTLAAGDAVLVPRDTVHAGHVVGPAVARGYSVFSPPFDGADRVAAPPQDHGGK